MPVDAPSEIRLGGPIDLNQRIRLILDGEVDAQEPTPSLDVLEERWGQRIAPRAEDDCDVFGVAGPGARVYPHPRPQCARSWQSPQQILRAGGR